MIKISPIYVLSRIKDLADNILKCTSEFIPQKVEVFNVTVPDHSDVLSDNSSSDLLKAKIVVVDPVLLLANCQKMPALEWAHSTWAGVECLFTSLKDKPKFIITKHSGESFGNMIAEYVLANILNHERDLRTLWSDQKQKVWNSLAPAGRTLDEIKVSVLGVGNMARAISRYFKLHGTTVVAMARTKKNEEYFSLFDKVTFSLEETLESCDYLVNTLPHTSQTEGLLNGEALKKCLKCPVFINVGRGSIIDETSLINAVKNNWIKGAVLDVFNEEPLPTSSPLWEMDMISITPHCAAISRADHIATSFLKCFKCYIKGEQLPSLVDWNAGY